MHMGRMEGRREIPQLVLVMIMTLLGVFLLGRLV